VDDLIAGAQGAPTGLALDSAGFEILDQAECFSLLSKVTLGRVAVTIGALPAIFPVNFCMVAGQVVFCSGEGTKLTAALSGRSWRSRPIGRPGRSVERAAGGRVPGRRTGDRPRSRRAAALRSLAPVPRRYLVKITPERISGRRLPVRSRLE